MFWIKNNGGNGMWEASSAEKVRSSFERKAYLLQNGAQADGTAFSCIYTDPNESPDAFHTLISRFDTPGWVHPTAMPNASTCPAQIEIFDYPEGYRWTGPSPYADALTEKSLSAFTQRRVPSIKNVQSASVGLRLRGRQLAMSGNPVSIQPWNAELYPILTLHTSYPLEGGITLNQSIQSAEELSLALRCLPNGHSAILRFSNIPADIHIALANSLGASWQFDAQTFGIPQTITGDRLNFQVEAFHPDPERQAERLDSTPSMRTAQQLKSWAREYVTWIRDHGGKAEKATDVCLRITKLA